MVGATNTNTIIEHKILIEPLRKVLLTLDPPFLHERAKHDDFGNSVLQHHRPEVADCVLFGALGSDVFVISWETLRYEAKLSDS